MTPAGPFNPAAPWLWAAISVASLVASFFVAFGVATTASQGLGTAPGALRLDLAAFLMLLGVLGILGTLAAGRIAFGGWLSVSGARLAMPLAGVLLATAVELSLHEWARVHVGQYDWDFMGPTAALSFVTVLCAVATFGVSVAPPRAAVPPRGGLGFVAAIACLIVASNVPGLRDGIEPESRSLATLIGLCGVYALVGLGLAIRPAGIGSWPTRWARRS